VSRNREKENEFIQKVEKLHSQFIKPEGGAQLALKGAEVLKNNWFFLFVDAMKEMKVPDATRQWIYHRPNIWLHTPTFSSY
jgi:non-specific serine/threonine protein kinase